MSCRCEDHPNTDHKVYGLCVFILKNNEICGCTREQPVYGTSPLAPSFNLQAQLLKTNELAREMEKRYIASTLKIQELVALAGSRRVRALTC